MTWPAWLTPTRRRVCKRAVKISLAAMLATWIAMLLGLPNPWFATLASIVALHVTLHSSLTGARNAIVGAAIGAGFGLMLALVAKDQIWAVGLVVLCCFAVFGLFRLEAIGRQAAIVASVIVLVPPSSELSTEHFAWIRLSETIIGIAAALVVNAFVMPPRAYRGVRRHLCDAYAALAAMYEFIDDAQRTGRRDADRIVAQRRRFRRALREIDDLWDEAVAEDPGVETLDPTWRATTRRIWEQCTALDDSVLAATRSGQLRTVQPQITVLTSATLEALGRAAAAFSGDGPIPDFEELAIARAGLFDASRTFEKLDTTVDFVDALQTFAYLNALNAIAMRMGELHHSTEAVPRGMTR